MTPEELRQRLVKIDRDWKFSDDEMLTAVGHLANHGYVSRLKTSQGEPRILLARNCSTTWRRPSCWRPAGTGRGSARSRKSGCWRVATLSRAGEAQRAGERHSGGFRCRPVPGTQRLFPRDRSAQWQDVSRLPGIDQSEEAVDRGRWCHRRRCGLYGQWLHRERVCLAGGADGLRTDVHAHEPVAKPGPLRSRVGALCVRLSPGRRASWRAGLRALLRHKNTRCRADSLPGPLRKLPGPPKPNGTAV